MPHRFFSISISSTIRMTAAEYYFEYKGIKFKYMSSDNPRYGDRLIGKFEPSRSTDDCYNLASEFVSAFAFETDALMIPEPGMHINIASSLRDYTGG